MDLKKKPFYLTDEEIKRVENAKQNLSLEQKVGQLFCVMGGDYALEDLKKMVQTMGIGSVLYRPAPTEEIASNYLELEKVAPVPLLHAANLEEGGSGGSTDGTLCGWPMSVGATGDVECAKASAKVCAREGRKAGINLSFSPVSDRSIHPLNPIVNVRSYGEDTELVKEMAGAYAKTLQENGVCACAKHFPGDGVDFRDQHLHPTYNSLSAKEWYDSYGAIYKNFVDEGIDAVMAGHIACPAVSMEKNPALSFEECLPGSLSKELLSGVLREEFGFNGVIFTDATIMGGYTMNMSRKDAIVTSVMAGADILVFSTDIFEDYEYLLEAVQNGTVTKERLDEALTRILALKTKYCCRRYEKVDVDASGVARDIATKSVTLVKDVSAGKAPILPVVKEKYDRIRLILLGQDKLYDGSIKEIAGEFFGQRGFEVSVYEPLEDDLHGTKHLDEKQLNLYLINEPTESNRTTVRLDWCKKHALDIPRFIHQEKSACISLSNPYHLMDIPRVPVYLNGYSATKEVLLAALKKVCGEEEFFGQSPVDAFCGLMDTRM